MKLVRRVNEIEHFVELITNLKKVDADKYDSKDKLRDLIDSTGQTLLHYSVRMVDVTTTQWLLDYGLDINAQTKDGETPLMIAIDDKNENMVKILLKANAKIDVTDSDGKTALERVNFDSITTSTIPGATMMKLIDKCETEEEASIKLYSANVPFHLTVFLQNSAIIKYYLDRGVDVNLRESKKGVTALHLAVHLQDYESVKLLLECGAEINAKDYKGRTPLAFMSSRYREISDQLKVLQLLLDQGTHLTTLTHNENMYMQVYWILRFCSKNIVRKVLQCNNIDMKAKDGRNNTLLHYLASNNNAGVFELLQDRLIDLDATNDEGSTVLNAAALNGHKNNIQSLLDRGADVKHQNKFGMTPLCNALMRISGCANDNIERIELLMQYGADVQMTSDIFVENRESDQRILYGKDLTIFDLVVTFDKNANLIEPVLAHLAMLKASGKTIRKGVISDINAEARFKASFNTYKRQFKKLKKIKIHQSVTMFQLLTVSEKQLLNYLRIEQLASKLEKDDYKNNQGVYYRKLRLRIEYVCRKVELKGRAVEALYKILQLPYNTHPIITDKICSYLNRQDLVLLGRI